jgi:hypothetical protein
MKLYRGDIGDFTGAIVASWFVTGVKGPMAFATGFVEMPCAPWLQHEALQQKRDAVVALARFMRRGTRLGDNCKRKG